MTYGKRQFENLDSVMRRLIPPFHQAMNELLHMVDADSSAFNSYMVSVCPTVHVSLFSAAGLSVGGSFNKLRLNQTEHRPSWVRVRLEKPRTCCLSLSVFLCCERPRRSARG